MNISKSLQFVSFILLFPHRPEFDDHDAHLSQTCINYMFTVISTTHAPESPHFTKSFKQFQKKLTSLQTISLYITWLSACMVQAISVFTPGKIRADKQTLERFESQILLFCFFFSSCYCPCFIFSEKKYPAIPHIKAFYMQTGGKIFVWF